MREDLNYQWKRIDGKELLTFKEFCFWITQIEPSLNSRNLIAVSSIPNDSSY
jgi:hypothetical protein